MRVHLYYPVGDLRWLHTVEVEVAGGVGLGLLHQDAAAVRKFLLQPHLHVGYLPDRVVGSALQDLSSEAVAQQGDLQPVGIHVAVGSVGTSDSGPILPRFRGHVLHLFRSGAHGGGTDDLRAGRIVQIELEVGRQIAVNTVEVHDDLLPVAGGELEPVLVTAGADVGRVLHPDVDRAGLVEAIVGLVVIGGTGGFLGAHLQHHIVDVEAGGIAVIGDPVESDAHRLSKKIGLHLQQVNGRLLPGLGRGRVVEGLQRSQNLSGAVLHFHVQIVIGDKETLLGLYVPPVGEVGRRGGCGKRYLLIEGIVVVVIATHYATVGAAVSMVADPRAADGHPLRLKVAGLKAAVLDLILAAPTQGDLQSVGVQIAIGSLIAKDVGPVVPGLAGRVHDLFWRSAGVGGLACAVSHWVVQIQVEVVGQVSVDAVEFDGDLLSGDDVELEPVHVVLGTDVGSVLHPSVDGASLLKAVIGLVLVIRAFLRCGLGR